MVVPSRVCYQPATYLIKKISFARLCRLPKHALINLNNKPNK